MYISIRHKLICNQSKIPIIVDADTGFGDLKNVFKTVKDLSNAGASALILEDQVFPKICALTDKVKLLDMKNASKRIKTAIKAVVGIIFSRSIYQFFQKVFYIDLRVHFLVQ